MIFIKIFKKFRNNKSFPSVKDKIINSIKINIKINKKKNLSLNSKYKIIKETSIKEMKKNTITRKNNKLPNLKKNTIMMNLKTISINISSIKMKSIMKKKNLQQIRDICNSNNRKN